MTGTYIYSILSFVLIFSCGKTETEQLNEDTWTIRQLVNKNFNNSILIGATIGSGSFGQPEAQILDREFSYVTPENDFKQSRIHPEPGIWNWEQADAWIDHIQENKQVLRIHGPISPQCSQWIKDDDRTPEELSQMLEEFFPALCKRYNSQPGIISMDVVNEVAIDGKWHKNKTGIKWECPWFIIGQDTDKNETPLYIKRAFEIANEFAPDLKLIFNHHEKTINPASWQLIKETITYLRNQGLRVDGIGWQSHIDVGWETKENLQALSDLIDWAHSNNLEFHITEASVFLKSTAEEDFQDQAKTYSEILKVVIDKRTSGVVGWNTWHVSDGVGWRQDEYPAIFDKDFQPKPAYFKIKEVLGHED